MDSDSRLATDPVIDADAPDPKFRGAAPIVLNQVSPSGVELLIRADGQGAIRVPAYDYLNGNVRAVEAVARAVAYAEMRGRSEVRWQTNELLRRTRSMLHTALLDTPADPESPTRARVLERRIREITALLEDDAQPVDDESVRCTCEWCSPEDGRVHARWPMVMDPHCAVHGRSGAEREAYPEGVPPELLADTAAPAAQQEGE